MDELAIHLDNHNGAVATWGSMVYVVWRSHESLEPVAALDAAASGIVAKNGAGRRMVYVHRAPAGAAVRLNRTVHESMMRHFDRFEPNCFASAVAVESTGVAASVVRTVAKAVVSLRKPQMRVQFFSEARDAIRWVADVSAGVRPTDAAAVIAALDHAGLLSSVLPS